VDGSTRRMSPELAERFEREAMPYRGQLLRVALQLTRHGQDAEDLVQDAITRACAGFHRFIPGTNLQAWLHRIMLNTFINGYRKRQREPVLAARTLDQVQTYALPGPMDTAWPSAEETVLSRTPANRLVVAMQELPLEFRQVLYLTGVEGFTYRETAEIMNIPLGTVTSRLHRARARLRWLLADDRNDGMFGSPARGERMGTRNQEVPHVHWDNSSNHRRGGDRYSADHYLHDEGTAPATGATIRT